MKNFMLLLLLLGCFMYSYATSESELIFYYASDRNTTFTSIDLGNVATGSTLDQYSFNVEIIVDPGIWEIETDDTDFFTHIYINSIAETLFSGEEGEYWTIFVDIQIPENIGLIGKTLKFRNTSDNHLIELDFTVNVVQDNTPPSTPNNLHVTSTTTTSLSLDWNASTDNVGVDEYVIYVDGVYYSSTTSTQITISGLSSNTIYSIHVRAKDAAGNQSGYTSVSGTTDPVPFTVHIVGPKVANNYDYYTWSALPNAGDVGDPPYTYLWEYNTTGGSTYYYWGSQQNIYTQMPLIGNLYLKVTITDSNGLQRINYYQTLNLGGFHKSAIIPSYDDLEIDEFENIELFPNPVSNELIVGLPNVTEDSFIRLYDSFGNLLLNKKITQTKERIDLSQFSNGAYLVKLQTDDQIVTKKIIKN